MRFVQAVQNQEIAWPTQRRFNRTAWAERARELSEDEADHSLAGAGIWVDDTLREILKMVEASPVWGLSYRELASCLLAVSNGDFASGMSKANSLSMTGEGLTILFADELIHKSFGQELFGSAKFSSVIETGIDAIEACLRFYQRKKTVPTDEKDLLRATVKMLNLSGAYQATVDVFYLALWMGWHVESQKDAWLINPPDLSKERIWEASYRRFLDLLAQRTMVATVLWKEDERVRAAWLKSTNGSPVFHLSKRRNHVRVNYRGRNKIPAKVPPNQFVQELMAREAYYAPLLNEPLPALNGRCVLDLLKVQFILSAIAERMMEAFPKHYEIHTPSKAAAIFCPSILRDTLVSSVAQAMGGKKELAAYLLEALTWSPMKGTPKSLWFQPLLSIDTEAGPGILLALVPLVVPNIYRNVDFWLTEFGLPLERRGQLFEQQIILEIQIAAKKGGVQNSVSVTGRKKLRSQNGESEEEFDLLLLLGDLIVVGEAKCQKLPTSPVETKNYISTLETAAAQALRKANWATQNRFVISEALGTRVEEVSGEVLPLVITNHSIGVGLAFCHVPVLDLLLLKNYLSRPYMSSGRFTAEGLAETKGKRFYNGPREMADNFKHFALSPPPLETYLNLSKASYARLPLRDDKPVLQLEYLMDTNAIEKEIA